MSLLKKKFTCRIEELPVLGGFVCISFETYIVDFINYSPDFKEPYLANYKSKLKAVEEIAHTKKIGQELKLVTSRLYKTMDGLREALNRLGGYVDRVENLSVNPKDFGIRKVRDGMNRRDTEMFLSGMSFLIQNIDENMERLVAKGFSDSQRELFLVVKDSAKADNDLQNIKIAERGSLVQSNMRKLNDLWVLMADIMKTGRILYKNTDAARAKEFTMTVLKERIRQEKQKRAVKEDV